VFSDFEFVFSHMSLCDFAAVVGLDVHFLLDPINEQIHMYISI
jgi:hypothetical protein